MIYRLMGLLTAVCVLIPRFSSAQDTAAILLNDVVIRENRLELPFSDQSRSVQILTRDQLAAMPVHTVAEALQSITGVDIRQRGPMGVQADIHVRGGGFDQVLVLLNGIRLSDPQTGHHLLNVPVDWASIERIEVLKGPGARIYGQNAFACAINIVTAVPGDRQVRAGVSAGDFGFRHGEIGLALPVKKYRQNLNVSGDFSDGYRHNTDFQVWNAFYQGEWKDKSAGEWQVMAGYTQRKFGANGYYGQLAFKDQYEAVQTNMAGISYRKQCGKWLFKPRVYWRRNQDWYTFLREQPQVSQNFHLSQVAGAEGNATWENRWGITGVGVGFENTDLYSSRLGERHRQTAHLFAEHRFLLLHCRMDITPGVAVSGFTDFGVFAYPGLDIGYRLDKTWKLFANAGYNYRIPTFTDLYYEDAGNLGNPDLKPERALSLEAGVKYFRPGWSGQVALFRRDGTNLIDYSKENPTDKWMANNFSMVLTQGMEISSDVFVPVFLGKNTWIRRVNAGYTYLDAQTGNQAAFSRYTLNHLRHQITAGLEHRVVGPVQHSIRLRWCDRFVSDPAVKSDYLVVDNKLSARVHSFTFFMEAANLLNATYGELRYSPTAVLTMPGRWFRAGFVYAGAMPR